MRMQLMVIAAGLLGLRVAGAQSTPHPATYKVTVVSPKNGEVVGPKVHVVLKADGPPIQTAGHHLFLDADLVLPDTMVPEGVLGIVRLGPREHEYIFPAVAPGPHRLIVVLDAPGKEGMTPLAADTVNFTVR